MTETTKRDEREAFEAACRKLASMPEHAHEKLFGNDDLDTWWALWKEARAALATTPEQEGEPVAWRIEHRPGRYTFTEHEENLKLDAGANIVPLYRAFHSVDAVLDSTLDRLESMVTWEPRLLAGPDAIDRLEHINRLLYELLNPHPDAHPPVSTNGLTDDSVAQWQWRWKGDEEWRNSDAENCAKAAANPQGLFEVRALYVTPPPARLTDEQIEVLWYEFMGHSIASGRMVEDAKGFALAIIAATEGK